MTGRGFSERRRGGRVVLRAWRMPLIWAFLWCCVCPPAGGSLLYGVSSVVVRQDSGWTAIVMGAAMLLVWPLCLVPVVRSLAARVVADSDGMTVHNLLGTVRMAWADIEDLGVIFDINTQSLGKGLWYGVAVRVRGRRRPLRMVASWVVREEQAEAFAQRLRSVAAEAGHLLPPLRPTSWE